MKKSINFEANLTKFRSANPRSAEPYNVTILTWPQKTALHTMVFDLMLFFLSIHVDIAYLEYNKPVSGWNETITSYRLLIIVRISAPMVG